MTFPSDYPNSPPSVRFTSTMWHPNGAWAALASRSMGVAARAPAPPRCLVCARPWPLHPPWSQPRVVASVYPDGKVCISILHTGNDQYGYELPSERWSPVQTVGSVMLSIISMLSSPNDESPANIDAAKQWRDDREGYRKAVARTVRKSQEAL